jgi:hypothetical protein
MSNVGGNRRSDGIERRRRSIDKENVMILMLALPILPLVYLLTTIVTFLTHHTKRRERKQHTAALRGSIKKRRVDDIMNIDKFHLS